MLECRLNNPGIPKNTPYRPLVGMQYRSKRIIVPRWVVAQPEHINRSNFCMLDPPPVGRPTNIASLAVKSPADVRKGSAFF